jgi:hypothetical protein
MRRALGCRAAEGGNRVGTGGEGRKVMTLMSRAHLLVREKRQGAKAKYTNPKGKCIHQNTPMAHRPSGPAGEVAAYGAGWAGLVGPELVRLDFKRVFPTVMIFESKLDFKIWLEFWNLDKEI